MIYILDFARDIRALYDVNEHGQELVPAGELDPNSIHTPGIFVQRIFKGEKFEKRIEQRTTRK